MQASSFNGGGHISSLAPASASASMDRTCQWVSSPDAPPDLLIRIAHDVFPLHKAVMVPKCGYIRKAVAAARGGPTATVELDLSALPGGVDSFEKAARYCYGASFEISVRNAAALLCAAAFLDMQPAEGGLERRVEEFLAKVGLRTLPSAVAVLRSCEGLLPAAEEAGGEASRARENEELRSELARMRAYMSGMGVQQSKGGGSSSRTTASSGKKGTTSLWLLGSVSRTLSRLNPFKGGIWAKDTSSIGDKKMHSVKPKRRRFSLS
uniref:BTB domain-containing protein n=1 Tax=Oryza brachyantha TaxID=4533 RepID=J3NAV2_ORYBR